MANESLAMDIKADTGQGESLMHCVCYEGRALALSILDADSDHMYSHAANLTEAARAVVRAAGNVARDSNDPPGHLAALLMAAEFLGSMSLVCSEEAARVESQDKRIRKGYVS